MAEEPRHLASRSAMLLRAVLRAETHALTTGETVAGLFHMAALLDAFGAEEEAAWRAMGGALAHPRGLGEGAGQQQDQEDDEQQAGRRPAGLAVASVAPATAGEREQQQHHEYQQHVATSSVRTSVPPVCAGTEPRTIGLG